MMEKCQTQLQLMYKSLRLGVILIATKDTSVSLLQHTYAHTQTHARATLEMRWLSRVVRTLFNLVRHSAERTSSLNGPAQRDVSFYSSQQFGLTTAAEQPDVVLSQAEAEVGESADMDPCPPHPLPVARICWCHPIVSGRKYQQQWDADDPDMHTPWKFFFLNKISALFILTLFWWIHEIKQRQSKKWEWVRTFSNF